MAVLLHHLHRRHTTRMLELHCGHTRGQVASIYQFVVAEGNSLQLCVDEGTSTHHSRLQRAFRARAFAASAPPAHLTYARAPWVPHEWSRVAITVTIGHPSNCSWDTPHPRPPTHTIIRLAGRAFALASNPAPRGVLACPVRLRAGGCRSSRRGRYGVAVRLGNC